VNVAEASTIEASADTGKPGAVGEPVSVVAAASSEAAAACTEISVERWTRGETAHATDRVADSRDRTMDPVATGCAVEVSGFER
jgi:hypothetical protein